MLGLGLRMQTRCGIIPTSLFRMLGKSHSSSPLIIYLSQSLAIITSIFTQPVHMPHETPWKPYIHPIFIPCHQRSPRRIFRRVRLPRLLRLLRFKVSGLPSGNPTLGKSLKKWENIWEILYKRTFSMGKYGKSLSKTSMLDFPWCFITRGYRTV